MHYVWYLTYVIFALVSGGCLANEEADPEVKKLWWIVPVVGINCYGMGGLLTCAVGTFLGWQAYERWAWGKLMQEIERGKRLDAERAQAERTRESACSPHVDEPDERRFVCYTPILEQWDREMAAQRSSETRAGRAKPAAAENEHD